MDIKQLTNFILVRLKHLTFIVFLLSILSLIPTYNFIIDIISQFKVQYFLFGVIGLPIFLSQKKKASKYIILCLTIILLNVTDILSNTQITNNTPGEKGVTISYFNVLTQNKNYEKVLNEILKKNPDIILTAEVNNAWLENFEFIRKEYPYYIENPRNDNFGIAFYSKIPTENMYIDKWTDWEVPVLRATLINKDTRINFVGIHTLPPYGKKHTEMRNLMFLLLQEITSNNELPYIAVGDFNTTTYSYAYKKSIKNIDFNKRNLFKKITGTWPTNFIAIFRIPIDQVITSKGLITDTIYNQNVGSDHLSVTTTVYFSKGENYEQH